MKAVIVRRYGGPEVLQLEEIPVPKPGHGEVLVRLHAAGVRPIDSYIRDGVFATAPEFPHVPYVPGLEGAGIVEEIGSGVTKFQKGQRVFTYTARQQGNYAQYLKCQEKCVFPLPDSVTFQQGAIAGAAYFTAYRALIQIGKSTEAKSVLIHGASGGVGLAAIQVAKLSGMVVYGTAGTEEGMKLIKKVGCDHVFNHREPGYLEEIKRATGGEGVDMITEVVAHINLPKDMEMIKKGGIIAVIGSQGKCEINPGQLMKNEGKIIGIGIFQMNDEELREAGDYTVRGLASGKLVPIIDKEYPLEKAQLAQEEIIGKSGAKGGLVLTID